MQENLIQSNKKQLQKELNQIHQQALQTAQTTPASELQDISIDSLVKASQLNELEIDNEIIIAAVLDQESSPSQALASNTQLEDIPEILPSYSTQEQNKVAQDLLSEPLSKAKEIKEQEQGVKNQIEQLYILHERKLHDIDSLSQTKQQILAQITNSSSALSDAETESLIEDYARIEAEEMTARIEAQASGNIINSYVSTSQAHRDNLNAIENYYKKVDEQIQANDLKQAQKVQNPTIKQSKEALDLITYIENQQEKLQDENQRNKKLVEKEEKQWNKLESELQKTQTAKETAKANALFSRY